MVLGSGQAASRSQVPWAKVGPGWALADYAAKRSKPGTASRGPRSLTVYLVSPAGGRYSLFTWPAGNARSSWLLSDWSGGKRALYVSVGARVVVHQVNLASGRAESFTLPPAVVPLGYTRPGSQSVLAARLPAGVSGTSVAILQYHLAGHVGTRLVTGSFSPDVAFSPSGAILAVGGRGELSTVSRSGTVIRRLRLPGAHAGCLPVRWWTPAVVLASCISGGRARASRLWLAPADGATPKAVVTQQAAPGLSFVNAWQLHRALYLQGPAGCAQGSTIVARQLQHGSPQIIKIPGSASSQIVTASKNRLLVLRNTCTSRTSLAWFNPRTKAVTVAVPVGQDAQGVVAAVPFWVAGSD